METMEMTKGRIDVPNEELTLAMQESEAMLANPAAKKFDSVEELFADLDAEE